MRNIVQILCLCLLFPALLTGQFSDNFSDGDLSMNPTWMGDVNNFKVNDIGQLQLDAPEAGESSIFLPIEIQADFTWEMDISLNFAPSDNNMARVYFQIDNSDVSLANGYYFEIGENLALDRLKFYRLDAGVPLLLAEGEMGALAQKPAQVSLRLDRVEGLWTVSTDYEKQGFPVEELNFFDDIYEFQTSGFFNIQTKYTSSNTDEIFIDNIVGKTFVPDIEGPVFVDFELLSDSQIQLNFNEAIQETSIDQLALDLNPNVTFDQAIITGALGNQVLLSFTESFQSGPTYTLNFEGLEDEKGNTMLPSSFNFVIPVSPSSGDLVINEILFDPLVGGTDYVEVLNRSNKILDLQGLKILNNSKDDEKTISSAIILEPGEIIAFSEDMASTILDYSPIAEARIFEMDIPSFNKDEGNVSILLADNTVLDSYDYTEDQHLSLIDETKGVSLERIFPDAFSEPQNFTSGVKTTNYGTPGYKNANFRNETAMSEGIVTIENNVFSPNSDGDQDQLIMLINLPDVGYLSTVRIYNIDGQLIRTVQNNQVTGKEDIVRWDGIMDDGGKAAIGHYIVHFQAFKSSGETVQTKKHVKLLDFF